mmetsp:Transcript_70973/g.167296  ORF Transcript_70973/g.167296 Transcript_70973/m.167296 type:complete len:83 (+) Transcript_70973:953-1201(+)
MGQTALRAFPALTSVFIVTLIAPKIVLRFSEKRRVTVVRVEPLSASENAQTEAEQEDPNQKQNGKYGRPKASRYIRRFSFHE